MITYKVDISKEYNVGQHCVLHCFLHEPTAEMERYVQNLDGIISVPGGGYQGITVKEGETMAIEFFKRNYNAFYIEYDVAPAVYPLALTSLACAVDYIKKHSEEMRVNKDRLSVMGYSAGGHLCGTLACKWKNLPTDYYDKPLDCSILASLLCYSVTDFESSKGSFYNLLGEKNEEKANALSLVNMVNDDNPPLFIWITATDKDVNPLGTLALTEQYLKRKIPMECHVFPYGEHAGATCDERSCRHKENYSCKIWLDMADNFIKSIKGE